MKHYYMNLKTKVFVLEVNNLSDARYCASMGVDTVAFSLVGEKASSLEQILAISQWLSGVKIGLEIEILNDEIKQFIKENNVSVVISNQPDVLKSFSDKITILKNATDNTFTYSYSTELNDTPSLIVDAPNVSELDNYLTKGNIKGLVLKGGEEERPGYKTFDELADILEALES